MQRAPRQWCLTKTETVNTFENWRQNLVYTLSLDPNFAQFIASDAKWEKRCAAHPNRGFTDDIDLASGRTAIQQTYMLDLMLGQIANFCPVISRNTIAKNATSLSGIWQTIRLHYGFQSTGAHFLDFADIHLQADERPEDLYQRLVAFVEDNMLQSGSVILHHGDVIDVDEEMSPSLENMVVLTWLRLINPALPKLIKQRYGTELRSRTLASIKPEISQALESLLDEIASADTAHVDAAPVAHHTPVPVPVHWQEEVKPGLDRDVRLGVVEPVPVGDPVTYCHRMVICAKKNGKPRRTVDMQSLNANSTRETHHTQSPFHQARSVTACMKKTVFDAWNGYHSVALHPDDRHLTTFITPWGDTAIAPQGYVASGDGYSRRFDEIASDFPDKTKCIDDTLLWATDLDASFHQATKWLDLCGRNGITLNPEKFVFGADPVEFAGFEITRDSVRPSQKYLRVIRSFPTPQNITDIRSWFGLINQVAYTFSMTERMSPFRSLLKPDTPFQWDDTLQKLFEEYKTVILDEVCKGVKIFDKTKPTCLVTDWSKDGIGFWLLQKHCDCQTTPASKPFCCSTGEDPPLPIQDDVHPGRQEQGLRLHVPEAEWHS